MSPPSLPRRSGRPSAGAKAHERAKQLNDEQKLEFAFRYAERGATRHDEVNQIHALIAQSFSAITEQIAELKAGQAAINRRLDDLANSSEEDLFQNRALIVGSKTVLEGLCTKVEQFRRTLEPAPPEPAAIIVVDRGERAAA